MHEYVPTTDGHKELRIYYGLKEISFDEPEFIAFGENLLKQDRFVAGSATAWSGGEPYPWERVKEMLESLLEEGVIERGEQPPKPVTRSAMHAAFLEQEARRVAPQEPLWWAPDCPGLFKKLTGRPLEAGYLETVMPVHRVAHAAFDADGRHVGEINVFPDTMRMKVPTEWRACPYPGSRFQDDMPMNVTALQAMTKVWRPVLEASLLVREEFLRRYPLREDGAWKLGDLHGFSCAALALPTLLMMRARCPVSNGGLDPVLSSLFRLVDGVRIVTLFLLFLPERPLTYDTPMTAAKLHYLTERDNHFLSTRGVCAGPPHMIDEFFATLVDGKPLAKGAQTPPGDWAADIPAAIDYGLYGVQLYSTIFTLWGRMCAAYERVRWALMRDEARGDEALGRLRARLDVDWAAIVPGRLHWEVQRAWGEARYAELFEHTQRGVRGFDGRVRRLSEALTPEPGLLGESARRTLRGAFRARASGAPVGVVDEVADAVLDYVRVERAALREVDAVQRKINGVLGREHPTRPLAGDDPAIHHTLRIHTLGGLNYFMDMFRHTLGVSIENTTVSTRVTAGDATFELA